MLKHTSKRHTDIDSIKIVIQTKTPKIFSVPKKQVKGLMDLINDYRISDDQGAVPSDEVFKDLYAKYGKSGSTLRGARGRDGLTQLQLSKKLGMPQSNISQIENGKRPIGKKLAKRLAKIFKTDYRVFL